MHNVGTIDEGILQKDDVAAELRRYVRAQYIQVAANDVHDKEDRGDQDIWKAVGSAPCRKLLDLSNKTDREKWTIGDYMCPNTTSIQLRGTRRFGNSSLSHQDF